MCHDWQLANIYVQVITQLFYKDVRGDNWNEHIHSIFFFGGGDGGEGEVNIFHTGYSEYINHQ